MSLFQIPEAPDYHLKRAPLVQALAQVRFPLVARLETTAGIAPLQDALSEEFPYMEQQTSHEVQVVLGPGGSGAVGSPSSVTWKLTDDLGRAIVIAAGVATLSVGEGYTNVQDFGDAFGRLITVLHSVVQVPRCDRLGVRYLSVAPETPGKDRSWNRWFSSELISWPGSDVIPAGTLKSTITQTELTYDPVGDLSELSSTIQAHIRHGAVPAGSTVPGIPPIEISAPSFLMDLDLFVAHPQPFVTDGLLQQFHSLHNQIDRFFYWTLTSDGRDHFGLEMKRD